MKKVTWKIGGEAGFGIMVSGLTFSKAVSRAGYDIVEINEYPSIIRGGHNTVAITISDEKIYASKKAVDILVALNKESIDLHISELDSSAVVIFDGEAYQINKTSYPSGISLLSVPLLKLAKSVGGEVLMRNTVALGASLALLHIPFQYLRDVLSSQFERKGEAVVTQNVSAAKAGYEFITQQYPKQKLFEFGKVIQSRQMVVTGAEAIGLGAIAAGMKYFAAYPMTPINGILTLMSSVQEKMKFVYKQPEDEIAGINMAIGASFAGVRSMVATSGGGFSLMVEGVSLAGMLEQPVVVIMGMRPGPATGLPTWTGQADLHFVLNASQGEFPRLVVAPGDVEEAFYLTAEAFNLADIYQTPVFVLIDKYLCESRFVCPVFDISKIQINRGKLLSEKEQNGTNTLARYALTDDGISPRGIPGRPKGLFRANSDEHNEHGFSEESAENTQRMIEKRMKKQLAADTNAPEPRIYGDLNADITLVGWGSTKGPILEALQYFSRTKTFTVNYLHLNYINPFPASMVEKLLSGAKRVIDIEGNHNSQMAQYIRMKTGFKIKEKILKYDGRPFYPEEIVEKVTSYVNA